MKALRSALAGCAAFVLATSAAVAACGFCAERVTLSAELAQCYLDRVDVERATAVEDRSEVHLVDLSSCLLSRSATGLPDVPTDGEKPVLLDEAFLIPVPGLDCLERAVRDADFGSGTVLTFEVRVDCRD